jgi:hypothetical protein
MASPMQETGYPTSEMDHTQLSQALRTRAPLYTPRSYAGRQRLWPIVPSGEDLYDPPTTAKAFARLQAAIEESKSYGSVGGNDSRENQILRAIVASGEDLYDPPITAEAFARLQAAIDEARYLGPASDNDDGGNQLLEPPTTAERFIMIESALDEALARPVTTPGRSRKPKKSRSAPRLYTSTPNTNIDAHLLRKRQLWWAQQATPAVFHHSKDIRLKDATLLNPTRQQLVNAPRGGRSQLGYFWRRIGEVHINPHKPTERPSSETDAPHDSSNVPRPDSDIFRNDASARSFADQTYEIARQKYL